MSIDDDQRLLIAVEALLELADRRSPIAAARGRLAHALYVYLSNATDHNWRELDAAKTSLRDLLAVDGA